MFSLTLTEQFSISNRTEWSPSRSVIIRVITKSDAQREFNLLMTSMITDRIGRHEVLLLINHKNDNFLEKRNSQVLKEENKIALKYLQKRCKHSKATTLPTDN